MKNLSALALVFLLASVGQSCARKAPPVTAPPPAPVVTPAAPPPPPPPPPATPAAPRAEQLSEDDLFARKTLEQLNAEAPLGDALFDYDLAIVREDARVLLQRNAEWLRRWPSTRVTVEGHSDERGTREYNIALGERRANAVRAYLSGLGVTPERVVVASMGREAPACVDATESCWQRNRRGRFVITAK